MDHLVSEPERHQPMKLTSKLKTWLVRNMEVKASATDEEFKAAAGEAVVSGTLTPDTLKELSTTAEDEEADTFHLTLKGITDVLHELKDSIHSKDADEEEVEEKAGEDTKKGTCAKCGAPVMMDQKGAYTCKKCGYMEQGSKSYEESKTKEGIKQPSQFEKMVTSIGGRNSMHEPDGEEKSFDIRVKEAAEMYSDTKSALTYPEFNSKGRQHAFAGQPVRDTVDGHTINDPSELDGAVAGSFSKFMVLQAKMNSRSLAFSHLPQHDKELLCYAMQKMNWAGSTKGDDDSPEDIKNRRLTPGEQKAIIDDSTSGGLEAAPIVFDDMVIQTPLLNGELFPLVNVVPIGRGRRIEGVATGTVTASWGGVDDTAISLFSTTSYVSAFDTTIFRWEGAIRIGLDFLSDTPIDFGAHVTAQYGERLLEDLDDVIAVGNGTTQPEGVMNKSGTTSVNFGGSTTLGSYESLRFGVAKNEHKANLVRSAVFCGTETSYQRARAIPVGASDARRLGGMDYSSYQWMERPYKINESLSNQQVFYAILGRYRMYRRRGLAMRTSTEGDTLIRNNEMLLVAMARYGGQLERGAVAAKTSTAPA